MKNFNQYITEKIKLSSDRFYNPDDLNNECEILYSDVRNQEYDWWDVYDGIKYINEGHCCPRVTVTFLNLLLTKEILCCIIVLVK